jgi:outer membrane protein assembly factor BamB
MWSTIPVGTSIDDSRNIYLTVADGIRKFSPDGTLLWTYTRTDPTEEISDAASLLDGAVYTISTHGRAFGVSMDTGEEVWSTNVSAGIDSTNGFVSAHAGVVVLGSDVGDNVNGADPSNRRVSGLNATDGSVLWKFAPDVGVWNFMASFPDDGTFVFQDMEGRAYRCSLSDGSLLWKAGGVSGTWTDGSALLGPNGVVYTVNNLPLPFPLPLPGFLKPGQVHARRLSDGAHLWTASTPKPPNNMPAIGRLYGRSGLSLVQPVGQQCAFGEQVDVLAFDAETGEQQWSFAGPTLGSVMVKGDAEGIAERENMGIRSITLPNPWSAPTIDGDGTVFIGSETGEFYALKDLNSDGTVVGPGEVTVSDVDSAFVGSSGPAVAPGILAVGSINKLYVWQWPT